MARTKHQDKYDEQHYVFQSVKVRRQLLDDFKATCAARGDRVNTVLREAMEKYIAGDAGDDVTGVTLSLDDMIAVCAVLDSLTLNPKKREDRFIADLRDRLLQLRDAAADGSEQRKNSV